MDINSVRAVITGGVSGLGLSVVYGLVKEVQGALKVESSGDKGTTFTLLLPVSA